MLHVDIPSSREFTALITARHPWSVSLFVPTTPETQHIAQARTELGNLFKVAEEQLTAAGIEKRALWPMQEQLGDLLEDDDFWAYQANGLAVLLTPDSLRAFRLPTHLTPMVQVSDRFHLKPLWRVMSVNQHAFVLAIEENGTRLIEVAADLPAVEVKVQGMPKDAASAAGTATVNSRNYRQKLGGGEGQSFHLRGYARKVDAAIRPVLSGRSEPLIVAAAEPMLSIARSVVSHDGLAAESITGSPARMTPGDLAAAARPILDKLHSDAVAEAHRLFDARKGEGRATRDIADAARAATFGAVDTLLIDMDEAVPGTVDETTGAVTFAKDESAASYGVVDEIAGRTALAGGRVMAVRKADLPDGASLMAILRYAV
jgi:hypothetical protein